MIRAQLNQGEIIQLNNRQYTIEKAIGDGATCIVYSAYYSDSMGYSHYVNIKECYPYNANIIRNGQALSWLTMDEKENSLTAFRNAYEKLMKCQNSNYSVHAFDICENNNTLYIVMDASDGVTFDKDTTDTLADVLKTVRLLAHVVGNYHSNGYLHLDIKPSNFLVYPRPSEHIVLFDMDTVTSMEDVKTGNVKGVSYSDGWAAPEQKQGKIRKLCPATDIFAIGAILFEKVMGRSVEAADMSVFADWYFEGVMFEDVNPKVKRLLRNIFQKTLSANIKRRYQSTLLLIKDLESAIIVAESKVYLKGDDVCCNGYFVGREQEIKQIKDSFDLKKKAVFLHGFGGIGKTEIARKYAELYRRDYDVVLFIKYDKSSTLQDELNEITILNFEADTADHSKILRNLLDDKTLVIVDNYDIEIGSDNGLQMLFDTKAHVVVSTRTDFSSFYNGERYAHIEVGELESSELEQMFIRNARINLISDHDRVILNKIFKLIQNHTYATELLAKQMYYSAWSFETLYQKIESGLASLENAEMVITCKDEYPLKDYSINIIRAVYRISELTAAQKQVLRNMSLLSFVKLNKSIYKELTSAETLNPLNELVEIGLIQDNGGFLSLHKLVTDLIKLELNPCWDNCIEIYNYVFQQVEKFTEYEHMVYDADCDEAEHDGRFLYRFFKSNGLALPENSKLAIHWLNKLVYMDTILWLPFKLPLLEDRLNKFERFLDDLEAASADAKNSIGVNYIRCIICLEKCEEIPPNQKKYSFKDRQLENRIISYFDAVRKLSEPIPNGKEILRSLGDRIFTSIHWEQKLVPRLVVLGYYQDFPSYYRFTIKEKRFYDIPINNKDQEAESLERDILQSEHYQAHILQEEELNELIDYFSMSNNKYDFVTRIVNSSQYNNQRKLQIINAFLDTIFQPLFNCFDKNKATAYIAQVDWVEIKLIVDFISDIQSDIFTPSWEEGRSLKYSYDEDNNEYEPYWDECEIDNDDEDVYEDEYLTDEDSASNLIAAYKAIISMIMGLNDFPILISKVEKIGEGARQDDKDFSKGLYKIMHICYLTDKCWIVIPYMFQALMDVLPDRTKEDYLIDVRAYYPMIRQVADYAERAKKEMAKDCQLSENFTKIYTFADNLANIIINKTFDIAADKED